MSGQIPLETRYYPNDFQITVVTWTTPVYANYPLMVADRDIVIDEVRVFIDDAPSTARNMKVKLMESTNGAVVNTAPTYATTAQDLSTAVKNWSLTTGDYPQEHSFALDLTKNFVPKGSRIWLQNDGAFAAVTGSMTVQIRWRSQY